MRIKTIIIIIFLSVIPLVVESQTWSTIGSGVTGIATTSCIAPLDKLYFGAGYVASTFAGTSVRGICSFNGENFDTLNQGICGAPNDMVWFNNKLIVSGQSYCAGIPPNCIPNTVNIAAWDSINGWQSVTPVGGGADYQVNCLEIYNNELYAAGQFVTIDNIPVDRIAKWNGTTWSNVGGGVTGGMGTINCMAVYHNQLYVGGDFNLAGNTNLSAYYIARWNGSSWDSVSCGLNWYVMDMVVDSVRDVLYVAGGFTGFGNTICRGVAEWNDTVWRPVGTGIDTLWGTWCLEIFNGELYAGGANETVSSQGDTLKNIYKFDGTKWVDVDGGANLAVMDMAVYNGNLYVGGYFTQVGNGVQASKIACYGTTCPTSVGISEYSSSLPFSVYPNPTREFINVTTGENRELFFEIYNVTGVLIDQRKFYKELQYSTSGLPSGYYTIRLSELNGNVVGTKILEVN